MYMLQDVTVDLSTLILSLTDTCQLESRPFPDHLVRQQRTYSNFWLAPPACHGSDLSQRLRGNHFPVISSPPLLRNLMVESCIGRIIDDIVHRCFQAFVRPTPVRSKSLEIQPVLLNVLVNDLAGSTFLSQTVLNYVWVCGTVSPTTGSRRWCCRYPDPRNSILIPWSQATRLD